MKTEPPEVIIWIIVKYFSINLIGKSSISHQELICYKKMSFCKSVFRVQPCVKIDLNKKSNKINYFCFGWLITLNSRNAQLSFETQQEQKRITYWRLCKLISNLLQGGGTARRKCVQGCLKMFEKHVEYLLRRPLHGIECRHE